MMRVVVVVVVLDMSDEIVGALPTCTKTIFLPGSELSVNDGEVVNVRHSTADMSLFSLARKAVGDPCTERLRVTVRSAVLNEPFAIATLVIEGAVEPLCAPPT
jgi:hypothetical protein